MCCYSNYEEILQLPATTNPTVIGFTELKTVTLPTENKSSGQSKVKK